jgi:hypothetical protein
VPSAIPEEIMSEVAVHSFFDITAEPQETVPFAPIDNPPPSSLAERLRALKEKQTRALQVTNTTNINNNNAQSAQISEIEGLVCFYQLQKDIETFEINKIISLKQYSE